MIEGGEVANEQNLKPVRTKSEARERGRNGGKASGEARRRKADFRRTLNMLLTAKIDSEEYKPVLEALGLECTLEAALNMAMIKEGLAGNVKAYEAIARYSGQSDRTELDHEEQQVKVSVMKAKAQETEEEEDIDDGFLDALNATAGEDWSDEET